VLREWLSALIYLRDAAAAGHRRPTEEGDRVYARSQLLVGGAASTDCIDNLEVTTRLSSKELVSAEPQSCFIARTRAEPH
jgi:hypothetical protein